MVARKTRCLGRRAGKAWVAALKEKALELKEASSETSIAVQRRWGMCEGQIDARSN